MYFCVVRGAVLCGRRARDCPSPSPSNPRLGGLVTHLSALSSAQSAWYVLQLNYASIVIYILKAYNCGLLRYINWNLGSSKLLPLVIFSVIILSVLLLAHGRLHHKRWSKCTMDKVGPVGGGFLQEFREKCINFLYKIRNLLYWHS